MLKMGQMCHCQKTLWQIDPDTGDIDWAVDRGADSNAFAIALDGSDVIIYECGDDANGTQVTKWLSASGGSPSRVWDYEGGSGINASDVEISPADSVPWAYLGTGASQLVRLDDSDGTAINQSAGLGFGVDCLLYAGPSGNMNMWVKGGTLLRQYDSSFGTVASVTLSGGGFGTVSPINEDSAVSGFLARPPSGFGAPVLHQYSSALADLATAGSSHSVYFESATATKYISGGLNKRTITGFSADWTQAGATPVENFGKIDASGNVYTIESASGTARARRRSSAAGTTEWTNTDIAIPGVLKMAVDATRLYVIGLMTESSAQRQVVAFLLADGSLEWSIQFSDSASDLLHDIRVFNGKLYVTGHRM